VTEVLKFEVVKEYLATLLGLDNCDRLNKVEQHMTTMNIW